MKKLLPIIFLFTVGCTSANKFDNRDKREPSAEAIKYRFDNFLLDTTLIVSLEEFPLDSNEKQLLIEKVIEHYDYYLELLSSEIGKTRINLI